jgi:hypothetical protein
MTVNTAERTRCKLVIAPTKDGTPDEDSTRCLVTTFAGAAFDDTFF